MARRATFILARIHVTYFISIIIRIFAIARYDSKPDVPKSWYSRSLLRQSDPHQSNILHIGTLARNLYGGLDGLYYYFPSSLLLFYNTKTDFY
jgi:hypothetical protein